MARTRRKIGEILASWGRLTEKQLKEGIELASASRKRLGDALIELGHATDAEVAKALAAQHNMEYIDLDQPNAVDRSHLKLVPTDIIKKYMVLPMGKNNGRIKVVVHDPMDLGLLDDLRFRLNTEVELALGAKSKIKAAIDQMLSERGSSIDELTAQAASMDRSAKSIDMAGPKSIDSLDLTMDRSIDGSIDVQRLADGQAPVIRLVDKIIDEAVNSRASDIHIEPMENRVRLRYRIDGVCHERDRIPKRTQSAVIARIKIMAGMKIQERRLPQDGRIKKMIDGSPVDFRVSACPAYHGESVVLRILRPESAQLGLRKLGMREDTLETFNRIIRRPNGIFLVTGPTGSGKTTTLYSALDVLNRPDRKIITAEDPVEYNFKGINQCQVNEQIGLSFAKILRAMLRQAPNIVLVGEIRDMEVGEVAVQAALTGHLVFSTLHTNDAPSAITRLIDMGIKPFLIASSVQAVLAQRLCRILCEECKEPETNPNQRMMRLCGITPRELEGKTIYRANGCGKCSSTGYKGREGIYELMVMNSELRDLAFARAPLNQMRAAALNTGMRSLLGDGKLKILDGRTTLEEIARITQVEGLIDEGVEEEAA